MRKSEKNSQKNFFDETDQVLEPKSIVTEWKSWESTDEEIGDHVNKLFDGYLMPTAVKEEFTLGEAREFVFCIIYFWDLEEQGKKDQEKDRRLKK